MTTISSFEVFMIEFRVTAIPQPINWSSAFNLVQHQGSRAQTAESVLLEKERSPSDALANEGGAELAKVGSIMK